MDKRALIYVQAADGQLYVGIEKVGKKLKIKFEFHEWESSEFVGFSMGMESFEELVDYITEQLSEV